MKQHGRGEGLMRMALEHELAEEKVLICFFYTVGALLVGAGDFFAMEITLLVWVLEEEGGFFFPQVRTVHQKRSCLELEVVGETELL